MAPPNIPARIGPIMGETSIEATRTTLEFSRSPMKAMMLAKMSRRRKSKENSAPASILAMTSPTSRRDLIEE